MSKQNKLYPFLEAFFQAEIYHVMDANHNAQKFINKKRKKKGFSEFISGMSKFYTWMHQRHFRKKSDNFLNSKNYKKVLGLDEINCFLKEAIKEKYPQKHNEKYANSIKDLEDLFFHETWLEISGILKKYSDKFNIIKSELEGKLNWDYVEVKNLSFLPDNPRLHDHDVIEHLEAKIARCAKEPSRYPYWKGFNRLKAISNTQPIKVDKNPKLKEIEILPFIKILCGLAVKYQIMIHFYRHAKKPVDRTEPKRIYAIFTFILTFSKYFPQYLTVDGIDFSILLRCLCHLRRGGAKFCEESGPDAFPMAFNEFEHASKLAGKIKIPPLQGKEIFIQYQHLIPVMSSFLKGELYRRDCSYHNAREFYYDGIRDCEQITSIIKKNDSAPPQKPQSDPIDSGCARVRALINLGKTYFELGEFRRSLKWLNRALILLISACQRDIPESFNKLDKILHKTKHEFLVDKKDLTGRLIQILKDFKKLKLEKSPLLTSEITNIIAMLLYQMRLVKDLDKVEELQDPPLNSPLAFEWLKFALQQDSRNAQAIYNFNLFASDWRQKFNTRPGDIEESPELQECRKLINGNKPNYDANLDLLAMDRWNRQLAADLLSEMPLKRGDKQISHLFASFLAYTDNFSKKNFELLKYLCLSRTIDHLEKEDNKKGKSIYLKTLRRWSSFTPSVPRPAAATMRGGGYFLISRENGINSRGERKGIVIDPGFDFLRNLYIEGHSLQDIDAIVVTHNHIDHTADLDPVLSLVYYLSQLKRKKPIDLIVNQGVAQRYSFYLRKVDPKHEIIGDLRVLGTEINLDLMKQFGFQLRTLRTKHRELGAEDYGLGLIFDFSSEQSSLCIGFTGDTGKDVFTDPKYQPERWLDELGKCHLIIANLCTASFSELLSLSGKSYPSVFSLVWRLMNEVLQIPFNEKDNFNKLPDLQAILWSLWFDPHELNPKQLHENSHTTSPANWQEIYVKVCYLLGGYKDTNKFLEDLLAAKKINKKIVEISKKRLQELIPPQKNDQTFGEHLFLGGISSLIEELTKKKNKLKSLVISEFREELGSFRHKIADFLSKKYFINKGVCVHTADTDLVFRIQATDENTAPEISIRCSQCKLNNDCLPEDAFHDQKEIREVCVKGEYEAMYYFCLRHTPGFANEYFIEKLPAYKPFDREFRY